MVIDVSWVKNAFRLRYYDTTLFFGPGVLREKLRENLGGVRRALVITSRSAARVSGALGDVTSIMRENGIEYVVYDKVQPNPYASTADEAAKVATENNVDAIIAIGGGSVIDVGKTVSIIAPAGIKASELVLNPASLTSGRRLTLVAVNLTHGTGSEVDRYAVLTIDGTIEKRGIAIRYPDVSFDDPLYTRTLSRDQTIYTSLDAFYHAYESATSSFSNQLTITMSREAVEITSSTLPKVLNDPANMDYRSRLLYASMIAGISIDQSMTHLNHALEHAFSGLHPELPHGAGLAILGPMVVYYTHKASPEASAHVLKPLDPGIKPISGDAERAYRAVKEFQESLGFDKRLSDYKVTRDDVEKALEFTVRMIESRYRSIPFKPSLEILRDIIDKSL